MDEQGWKKWMGDLSRETMGSPEVERYFSIPITKKRAQIILTQLSLYVRHRRDCWAHVSGNCPEMSIKQKILEHEYEELVRDAHSEHGHLDLLIRQGKSVGLTTGDIMDAKPLPTTTATLYAWGWMTKEKSWLEGLASMTITEWNQDDRLLGDMGGGHAYRMGKRWIDHLGLTWDDLPNWVAHREADKKHSDMFLSDVAHYAVGDRESLFRQAARESENLYRVYQAGIADAMEAAS